MSNFYISGSNSIKFPYAWEAIPLRGIPRPSELPEKIKKKPLPKNKKIILVSPHSDDISVSIGGTVSSIAAQNQIKPFLLFSGHRGVKEKDNKKATQKREREMKQEAKILNIDCPLFLKLSSYNQKRGVLEKNDILKLRKQIRKINPDIIFLPKKDDHHPTHKLATKIALEALKKYDSIKPELLFYENPWSLFDNLEFNLAFFYSKKELNRKIKAVRVHKSQLRRTPFDKASRSLAELRGAITPEQRIFGYGNEATLLRPSYAEVFKIHEDNS